MREVFNQLLIIFQSIEAKHFVWSFYFYNNKNLIISLLKIQVQRLKLRELLDELNQLLKCSVADEIISKIKNQSLERDRNSFREKTEGLIADLLAARRKENSLYYIILSGNNLAMLNFNIIHLKSMNNSSRLVNWHKFSKMSLIHLFLVRSKEQDDGAPIFKSRYFKC